MKLIYSIFLILFTISCTQSKVTTDRSLDSVKKHCARTDLKISEMQKGILDGSCSNLNLFCDISSVESLAMSFGKSTTELRNNLLSGDFKPFTPLPWINGIVPEEKSRLRSYNMFLSEGYSSKQEVFNAVISVSDANLDKIKNKILSEKKKSAFKEMGLVNTPPGRTFICSFLGIRHSLDCQKGIKRITEIMSQAGEDLTFHDGHIEVLTDRSYFSGLQIAAKTISDKVELGGVPRGHVFNDIFLSFQKAGLSNEQSLHNTFTTIMAVSVSGADYGVLELGGELIPLGLNPVVTSSLQIIAQSLPILAFRSRPTGKSYDLPSGISLSCDNGKHYHFWASAYLTWRLIKEGISPRGAANAAFTVFKGYTFLSRSTGRFPEQALYEVDTFNGMHNIYRLDLVYSAAATKFAVDFSKGIKSELNIDDAYKFFLAKSKQTPAISQEEANKLFKSALGLRSAYSKWSKRFPADEVYWYFHK